MEHALQLNLQRLTAQSIAAVIVLWVVSLVRMLVPAIHVIHCIITTIINAHYHNQVELIVLHIFATAVQRDVQHAPVHRLALLAQIQPISYLLDNA